MNEQYDVLGVGIAAVDDLFYVEEYPPVDCKIPVSGTTRQGGGPACTAIATAGELGGRVAFVARFGEDELSKYIVSSLEYRGVDTSHIVHDLTGGPYHSAIIVDRASHRNVFYDPRPYKTVNVEDLPDSLIQLTRLVLLDHITEPSLVPVAEKVHGLGVPILADIEGRTESAMKLAGLADYLIVPNGFASWASGETDLRAACISLARTRRLATVVTDGPRGCYVCTGQDSAARHFPAFQVRAFDTNGCGDAFHGAFALAISRNLNVEQAILFASAVAALKAMAGGGRRRGWEALPALDEVLAFLQVMLEEPAQSLLLTKLQLLRVPSTLRD